MSWLAGVIAQPVLIGDAVGMSLRVIPSMLLHTACLTANGEGCCSRIAGLEMTMKIRSSSFGLAGRPGRDLAGIRGRLPPLSEIWGSLATSAQERRSDSWLPGLLWLVSLLQRELGGELLGESEVRA
jgi:hypothetical protein